MKTQNEQPISIQELTTGFSKLSQEQREVRLVQMDFLTNDDITILTKEGSLSEHLANHFVENAIGFFPLPLGVAVNFVIDGKDFVVPMAVEETSVIAGASKTAKWIRDNGSIKTQMLSHLGIGQIQFPIVKNYDEFTKQIESHKEEWVEIANIKVAHDIVSRGGGVRDISCRQLTRGDGHHMAVLHVLVDTCDAMGANTINQVCEFLKPLMEEITHEKVGMCILSNLMDTKLTQAKIEINNVDPALGKAISEGSLFAQCDPYRAATNNKGVMNGIDAVLIATGNDWRAVEAGVHAYASLSGQYTSITKWTYENNVLHGVLEAPIIVGIVGGVTRLHPVAKICLKMLKVKSAGELSRVLAAVGLVQNLAAITALVTEGISQGHMKLHISNLVMATNATSSEIPILKKRLEERLAKNKRVTESDVNEILNDLRK